jgi:hypothetical protein
MGMEDFTFMLHDLAVAFREDAMWRGAQIPGRFYINPQEVGLGDIEPGLGTVETKFYCDRVVVPKPWPSIGDTLVIREQVYEIVERDEDDLGEFAFRLIKAELGLNHVTSEGAYGDMVTPHFRAPIPPPGPGRPTRRAEVLAAYDAAIAARLISPTQPLHEICAALRPRIGNGAGLADRTLRKIVGGIVRARQGSVAG